MGAIFYKRNFAASFVVFVSVIFSWEASFAALSCSSIFSDTPKATEKNASDKKSGGLNLKARKIKVAANDSPIFRNMNKPWSMDMFSEAHSPVHVGPVENRTEFSSTNFKSVQDMPIKMPGNEEFRIPPGLEQFLPAIQKIIDYEKSVNPEFNDFYAYLTLDNRPVKANTTQRVPGAHVDGIQGERYSKKLRPDHAYLVSSSVGTTFYNHKFDMRGLSVERDNLFSRMEAQADERRSFEAEPYEIYLMDAFTVHRASVAKKDTERVFLRLEFSQKVYDRIGNTKNELFDYDWNYVPRPVPENLKRVEFSLDEFLSGVSSLMPDVNAFEMHVQKLMRIKRQAEVLAQSDLTNLAVDGRINNPIRAYLSNHREKYLDLMARFHNEVYLPSKIASSKVFISAEEATPKIVSDLIQSGILHASKEVMEYVNRSTSTSAKHYKFRMRDVKDLARFSQFFKIPEARFHELQPESVIFNSLHSTWSKIIESEGDVQRRESLRQYMVESQLTGISNLLALVIDLKNNTSSVNLDYVLHMINSFYSYDNPSDGFSLYGFKSKQPAIRGYETDWRVFRNFLKVLGLESQFSNLIREGDARFPTSTDIRRENSHSQEGLTDQPKSKQETSVRIGSVQIKTGYLNNSFQISISKNELIDRIEVYASNLGINIQHWRLAPKNVYPELSSKGLLNTELRIERPKDWGVLAYIDPELTVHIIPKLSNFFRNNPQALDQMITELRKSYDRNPNDLQAYTSLMFLLSVKQRKVIVLDFGADLSFKLRDLNDNTYLQLLTSAPASQFLNARKNQNPISLQENSIVVVHAQTDFDRSQLTKSSIEREIDLARKRTGNVAFLMTGKAQDSTWFANSKSPDYASISLFGESKIVVSGETTLVGGQFENCFSKALVDLSINHFKRSQSSLKFRVPMDAVYRVDGQSLYQSYSSNLKAGNNLISSLGLEAIMVNGNLKAFNGWSSLPKSFQTELSQSDFSIQVLLDGKAIRRYGNGPKLVIVDFVTPI